MSGVSRDVLTAVRKKAEAAGQNEMLTRQRVTVLEEYADRVSALLSRGLWGRLRWLLRGK